MLFRRRGDYLQSPDWQADRRYIFKRDGYKCLKCGSRKELSGDHIYARSVWPWLEHRRKLQQTLCLTCNKEKGVKIEDYRPLRYRVFLPIRILFLYYWAVKWGKRLAVLGIILMMWSVYNEDSFIYVNDVFKQFISRW